MIHNERGSAMLVSLGMLLMLALIGIGSVNTSVTDMSISNNLLVDSRSFLVAESGAQLALSVIMDSSDWREGFSDYEFDGGTFNVDISDKTDSAALGDTVVIVSTGNYSEGMTTVELRVLAAKASRYKKALFGDELAWLKSGPITNSYDSDSGSYASTVKNTDGDVGSNKKVWLESGTIVNGDVEVPSAGTVVNSGSTINGTKNTNADPVVLEPITADEIAAAKASNKAPSGFSGSWGSYNAASGDLSVSSSNTLTLNSGTYWFRNITSDGNIKIATGASVKIYVGGVLEFKSGAKVNSGGIPGNLEILSYGSLVDISSGGEVRAAIYAPMTPVTIRSNLNFYGAVVGKSLEISSNTNFHYDRALGRMGSGSSSIDVISWREL